MIREAIKDIAIKDVAIKDIAIKAIAIKDIAINYIQLSTSKPSRKSDIALHSTSCECLEGHE
jgi:hypothetical protein